MAKHVDLVYLFYDNEWGYLAKLFSCSHNLYIRLSLLHMVHIAFLLEINDAYLTVKEMSTCRNMSLDRIVYLE